jgi:hypothetical protein
MSSLSDTRTARSPVAISKFEHTGITVSSLRNQPPEIQAPVLWRFPGWPRPVGSQLQNRRRSKGGERDGTLLIYLRSDRVMIEFIQNCPSK